MSRVLGIDFGDVRTGIAVSDESGFLAGGVATITAEGLNALASKIGEYVKTYSCDTIVLGNPVNMNGTLGPRSEKAAKFAELLRGFTGCTVVLYDERRTTMTAASYLNETNTRGKKRKSVIDTLSAQIILQNYLDSVR